jgi:hypothetical protein
MDLIDEANQDYKDIARAKFFKRLLLVAFVVTIFAAIINIKHKSLQQEIQLREAAASELFIKAADPSLKPDEAITKYNSVIGGNGFSQLAELAIVRNQLLDSKNIKKAMESLHKIVTEERSEYIYTEMTRSYAALQWISLALDDVKGLSEQQRLIMQEFLDRFDRNIDRHLVLFYGQAQILKALWLIEVDNKDEARELLKSIIASSNSEIKQEIKDKAAVILHSINF